MSLPSLVLGAVIEKSQSGYDVHKTYCNESGINLWPASHQQVYRECNKMQAKGLMDVQLIPQSGKPDRKVYTTTEAGNEEMINMMLDSLRPQKVRSSHAVSLMFLPHFSSTVKAKFWEQVEETRADLSVRIEELDQQLSVLDHVKNSCKGEEDYANRVLRLRIIKEKQMLHNEVDWLDRVQLELG